MIAEELARRAALAIDNAKLYRAAQDAIRTRDEFYSLAAHELKTPITAIKLVVNLIRLTLKKEEKSVPSVDKFFKMLDNSNLQLNRLTQLVEDLLDVVKIREGKLSFNFEELNLSDAVKDVAERYFDALASVGCPLELKLQPMVIGVWDPHRIEQILINLISNVIKYAPGKPIKIESSLEGETARLIVQDFGPGISPEQQTKIFERYERSQEHKYVTGLGLGLFLVKQIVDGHHGTIRVESKKGSGSKFIVELPAKPLGTHAFIPTEEIRSPQ